MADDTPSLAERVAVLEAALQEIAGYSCTCHEAFVSRGKVDPDCMAGEVGDTAREALGLPMRCRGLAAEHNKGRQNGRR
jgi:hypothetical protein